jgi:hypothetical protein
VAVLPPPLFFSAFRNSSARKLYSGPEIMQVYAYFCRGA